jgi:hypothetical protein
MGCYWAESVIGPKVAQWARSAQLAQWTEVHQTTLDLTQRSIWTAGLLSGSDGSECHLQPIFLGLDLNDQDRRHPPLRRAARTRAGVAPRRRRHGKTEGKPGAGSG